MEGSMIKKIKSRDVKTIPKTYIPYKNRWGHFVWTDNELEKPMNWPGIKPPDWANGVKYVEEKGWCWYD
jgi:hypothetical protein